MKILTKYFHPKIPLGNYKNILVDSSWILRHMQNEYWVYIASGYKDTFDINIKFKQKIFTEKIQTFFKYGVDLNSFIDNDYGWDAKWINTFNHIGRVDDNDIYKFTQSLSMQVANSIEITDESLSNDFNRLKETTSLQSAEYYTLLLRNAVMIIEQCNEINKKFVVLCGADLNFSLSLYYILKLNGIDSVVLKPENMGNTRSKHIVDTFESGLVESKVNIPIQKINFNDYLVKFKSVIEEDKKMIFTFFRANDNVYFELINLINKYMEDYKFYNIDRIYNDNIHEKLMKNNLLSTFIHLSSNVAFLNSDDRSILIQDLKKSLQVFNNKTYFYKNYNLDSRFLLYGINNFSLQLLRTIFYYRIFNDIFKDKKPFSLIASPARSVEARMAIEAAKDNNIRTYELQGGTITYSKRFWKSNADFLLCSDSLSKNIYIDFFNLKEHQVKLVGSPRLDENIAKHKKYKKQNTKRIFLALQTFTSEVNIKLVKNCLEAIEDMKEYSLVIGFHPRDNKQNKADVIKFCKSNKRILISTLDSLSELESCDFCITYFSFLGIEAFALGCKVIALNIFEHKEWPYRLSSLNIALEAYNSNDIKKILQNNIQFEINNENMILKDGLSLQRIKNIVEETLYEK